MSMSRFLVAFILTFTAFAASAADPTVAFYTFNDAAPGTDATTVSAISNSLDETAYVGSVTKTENGTVEFRAEAPGAYILNGVDGVTLAKDPQSLWFDGTAVAEGGNLSLAEIMDTLAPGGMDPDSTDNAYTIEFFFMKPTTLTDYTGTTLVQVPRTSSGGMTTILVPSDNKSLCRLSIPGANRDITMDEPLQDGKWHHMAISFEKKGSSVNHFMTIDYTKETAGWPTGLGTDVTGPVVFGGSTRRFRGYISCVRVSHKMLTANEMLKASDSPLYDPGDDDVQVSAVTPKEGTDRSGNWWCIRHDAKLAEIAERGDEIETVFLGDSITSLWESYGRDTWPRFASYHPINLGYTADSTGHVLWRIAHGELDGYKAKVISILIGTNNLGGEPLRHTWRGVKAIVDAVREKQPQAKIILTSILPRGAGNDDLDRRIRTLNGELAKIADGKDVFWLDIYDKFLNADGTLNTSLYYDDKLHLFQKGYPVYADNLLPLFDELYSGERVVGGETRPGTVAFYRFDDAAPGVCITNITVKNAVDAARFPGTAVLWDNGGASYVDTGVCEFSRERPGKYVFDGADYGAKPFVTNPRSLHVDGLDNKAQYACTLYSGGKLSLQDLATELLSNLNYTVEFFYMIPKSASGFAAFDNSFSWVSTNPALNRCGLTLPTHSSGASDTMNGVDFSHKKYGNSQPGVGYKYPAKLKDGLWHHVAAVRKNGKMQLWHDYVKEASEPSDTTEVLDYSRPLVIANAYRFRGYVSCFRVLTNALDATQMLHASNDEQYAPRTVCHWTFDGEPGESLTTVSNVNASAYAEAFAGQYGIDGLTGNGTSAYGITCTNEFAYGRPYVLEGTNLLAESYTGGGFPYSGGFKFVQLPRENHIPVLKGSFTIETFFKFVGKDTWLSRPGRPSTYCTVCAKPATANKDGRGCDFWFGFWVADTPSLQGHIQAGDSFVGWAVEKPEIYDGKWHHYAYAYDEENLKIYVYFDYDLAKTVNLSAPLKHSVDPANECLSLGTGGYSAGGFEGVMDEFRYSRGVLTSDQLLRTRRHFPDPGLLILFR